MSIIVTAPPQDEPTDFVCVGEYRIILLLVGVLSRGKVAKKLADRAIDLMEDVQNLRKAIYPYVNLAYAIYF